MMIMSTEETIITILVIMLGTMITRFLPFIIFPNNKTVPSFIRYLGKVLPFAVIGLLVVYGLKDISLSDINNVLPQAISVIFIIVIHMWKKNMLLSICTGTILYMILVQFVFVT